MEVKDLMIGDWVKVPSELHRYKQIRSTTDLDYAVLYRPIPVDNKILEGNGFLGIETIGWMLEYNNYTVIVDYWNLNMKIILADKIVLDKSFEEFIAVHDIQHVFHLFNIDKQIVL